MLNRKELTDTHSQVKVPSLLSGSCLGSQRLGVVFSTLTHSSSVGHPTHVWVRVSHAVFQLQMVASFQIPFETSKHMSLQP